MRLPPLNALRAFEAAARHQGYIAAADELCVTPGAISRHIKRLEEHLGTNLFYRHSSGVELTAEGKRFLPVLTAAFRDIAAEADRLSTIGHDLSIICPPTMSIRWLIPKLEEFKAMRPEVRIRLTTDFFGNKGFDPDEFDIGFSVENVSGRAQNIVATPIFPKVMSPACAPQLLHPIGPLRTPSDLSALKLLHESRDREDWKYWVNHFHVANIDPNSGDVFPNLDMATKAAVMGSGVVMADLMLCRDELESGALVLPFKNLRCETPHGQYCFIVSAERVHGPNLKKFITWLDEIKVRNEGYCILVQD